MHVRGKKASGWGGDGGMSCGVPIREVCKNRLEDPPLGVVRVPVKLTRCRGLAHLVSWSFPARTKHYL